MDSLPSLIDALILQLEARRVREVAPLTAAEVALLARAWPACTSVSALVPHQRGQPRLTVARARKAPAEPAGV